MGNRKWHLGCGLIVSAPLLECFQGSKSLLYSLALIKRSRHRTDAAAVNQWCANAGGGHRNSRLGIFFFLFFFLIKKICIDSRVGYLTCMFCVGRWEFSIIQDGTWQDSQMFSMDHEWE